MEALTHGGSPMDTKFQKFLNFFVITYACWTAYTHFNVYINNSFTDLITYSPILLLLIGLLLFYYSKSENPHLSAQSAKSEHGSHANPKTHSWIIATGRVAEAGYGRDEEDQE